MKLVAMLRIKNQMLTIRECLDRLCELVDEIVIVDNGSTDGTIDIYKEYKKIVAVTYTEGFDEGRDKIYVHEVAKTRDPDWIMWIDADEVFEDSLTLEILNTYMEREDLGAVWFRLYHFWDSKDTYRIDSKWHRYTAFPQRMMWRNTPDAYFRDLKFHNGGIMGVAGKRITAPYRLKHFGYIHADQRTTKDTTYKKMQNDPLSVKTMPLSREGMKLKRFKPENRVSEFWYWNFWQLVYHYSTIIKSKISHAS